MIEDSVQATTKDPIKNQLISQLQPLSPTYIDLQNESMNHAGYFAGKESHFKLTIVSEDFTSQGLVARHQKVYGLVANLLTQGGGMVHALAIHAYTPDEWQIQGKISPDSPNCAGQSH